CRCEPAGRHVGALRRRAAVDPLLPPRSCLPDSRASDNMDIMSSISFRRVPSLALLGVLSAGTLTSAWAQGTNKQPGKCVDEYSDSLTVLNAKARELDTRAQSDYTFCIRNTAVYECLSYGTDGTVKRQHEKAVLHGTAFAYKRQDGDTLLLTNEHVAVWPAITDDEHRVEDVPQGCKK